MADEADQGVTTSPPTLAGGNLLRVINNVPGARHAYYGHLHELCNPVFTGAYFTPWLQHYGSVVGQSMTGGSGYIEARRNYILTQLPATVTFAITTNGGADFSVNTSTAALAGSGWIDVREIRRSDAGAALDIIWTSDTTWTANVAVNFGPNPITLNAYNSLGALVGTDTTYHHLCPISMLHSTSEAGYLTMTLTKQPGLTYEVQTAGTLLPEMPDSFSASTTMVLIHDPTHLKVRDIVLLGTSPARYIRVKVTAAP